MGVICGWKPQANKPLGLFSELITWYRPMSSSLGFTQAIQGARVEPHTLSHTDLGPLCIQPEGLALSLSKQADQTRMEAVSFCYPWAPRNSQDQEQNAGFLPRGRTHRNTRELSELSSPMPAGLLPTLWCPRPPMSVRLMVSPGPRSQACSLCKGQGGSLLLLQGPERGPEAAAASCGQGSEPIPRVRANSGHQLPHSAALP